jgi:hypothetical protein
MKSRVWRFLALGAAAAGAIWGFLQVSGPSTTAPLAGVMPSGAVLYVEARDFASLVKDWNASPEKAAWLKSDNYSVFSRSKLFTRLEKAEQEYAKAAGFPASMATLANIAGTQSALALYDIGELRFVYVARMSSSLPAVLTAARPAYQTRKAGGVDYFVSTDKESGRVAAFAFTNDTLVLGTDEGLVASTLLLLSGGKGPAITGDGWYDRAVKTAGAPGEVRIVANIATLDRSPHFRSYWVQQNITELKQFAAFVSDLNRASGELREERVLVRNEAPDTTGEESAVLGGVLPLVPATEDFYQAWAAPKPQQVSALIAAKLLAPRSGLKPKLEAAPAPDSSHQQDQSAEEPHDNNEGESSEDNNQEVTPALPQTVAASSTAELETRIDEAPLGDVVARFETAALDKVLAANPPAALMQIESAQTVGESVLVGTRAAVVVLGRDDWSGAEVRAALAASIAGLYSTSGLGMAWTARGPAFDLNGLVPLSMATRGHLLVIASEPSLVDAVLAQPAAASPAPVKAVFAAGYQHARELPLFRRMTRMIDGPPQRGDSNNNEHVPAFFSENMASLGNSLKRVQSASIVVRDTGATVPQSVVYRYAAK